MSAFNSLIIFCTRSLICGLRESIRPLRLVDHGDARFPPLWQDLAKLPAKVLDLLVALVLLPAVLLVEEGLPALVLGEVKGLDGHIGKFERTIVGAAEKAHDTVDPAELPKLSLGRFTKA